MIQALSDDGRSRYFIEITLIRQGTWRKLGKDGRMSTGMLYTSEIIDGPSLSQTLDHIKYNVFGKDNSKTTVNLEFKLKGSQLITIGDIVGFSIEKFETIPDNKFLIKGECTQLPEVFKNMIKDTNNIPFTIVYDPQSRKGKLRMLAW